MTRHVKCKIPQGDMVVDLHLIEAIMRVGPLTFVFMRSGAKFEVSEDADALRALWTEGRVPATVPGQEAVHA